MPLSATDRDRYYGEPQPAATLYGTTAAPASEAEVSALFEKMRGKLEASPILFEFLDIVRGRLCCRCRYGLHNRYS